MTHGEFTLKFSQMLTEYEKEIRVDGAREFAEWLVDNGILGNRCIYNGEITDYGKVYLAKWEKGDAE